MECQQTPFTQWYPGSLEIPKIVSWRSDERFESITDEKERNARKKSFENVYRKLGSGSAAAGGSRQDWSPNCNLPRSGPNWQYLNHILWHCGMG
ncbi:hypothetical protein PISMIDRAFT_682951 [Pisolithus microcarpus 441]|uniref:Uncharacterized protein n=1 Tax=Pisolithus microcarpus 441 TaxID=765257 RepID=A0A0C9ZI02_9AGAM|nr:hypothetical protein PISMIDRAFT_682951 [Pisolithus microcarpus 441]